jgi:hypothetical protein
MKTFKNVSAENKSHVTNVYFAEGASAPVDFGVWVECSRQDLEAAKYSDHLYTQNGIRFYGRI